MLYIVLSTCVSEKVALAKRIKSSWLLYYSACVPHYWPGRYNVAANAEIWLKPYCFPWHLSWAQIVLEMFSANLTLQSGYHRYCSIAVIIVAALESHLIALILDELLLDGQFGNWDCDICMQHWKFPWYIMHIWNPLWICLTVQLSGD